MDICPSTVCDSLRPSDFAGFLSIKSARRRPHSHIACMDNHNSFFYSYIFVMLFTGSPC